MSLQIFKSQIPNQVLIDLFDKICVKTKDFYIINNISFKKGTYNTIIQEFLEICRKHYHISKKKYIDKPLTYNSFITVIRQICKYNKIQYKNEIKYDKSSYDIHYYIFLESINAKQIEQSIEEI
jgi:hypothetical protein